MSKATPPLPSGETDPTRGGDQTANSGRKLTDYQLMVSGMTIDDVYSISRSLNSDVGVRSDVWLTVRVNFADVQYTTFVAYSNVVLATGRAPSLASK